MRLPEQRTVVVADLVGVPGSRNQDRDSGDDREDTEQRTTVERTRDRRDHQHQDDDADRPQRPRTNELRKAEHQTERRRYAEPVVGADEEPSGEDERCRREQHRQGLGMEHRSRLHDDRAYGEEDDRREVEGLSSGPEQAHEDEEK